MGENSQKFYPPFLAAGSCHAPETPIFATGPRTCSYTFIRLPSPRPAVCISELWDARSLGCAETSARCQGVSERCTCRDELRRKLFRESRRALQRLLLTSSWWKFLRKSSQDVGANISYSHENYYVRDSRKKRNVMEYVMFCRVSVKLPPTTQECFYE